MKKLIRITTVPESLEKLLEGQISFMKDHYQVIAVSSNKERMEHMAVNEEINTYSVNLTRKITPLQDLKALWQLYKIFKKESPYIVHTHTPKAGTIGMLAAKLAGVPHRLHTVAGLPLLEVAGKKRKLLDVVEKLTYTCASKVYPNSFGLKEIIKDLKFARTSKLKVIEKGSSNGIDTNHFSSDQVSNELKRELKKELGIKELDFVFVFVGRVVGDKGVNEILKAFDELCRKKSNVKLILVGGREDELDPISEESHAILNSNISVLPVGFKKDVRPFFSIANALVFPSYREGFPNVVLQAGSMGITSIVSDINGCNEIIQDGINGKIVPPKNSESLLKIMTEFIENMEEVEKMGKNARPIIVSNYARNRIWKALLTEYKSLDKL